MSELTEAKDAANISERNSKMPGTTFSITATKCQAGSKLAQVKGSVCEKCYALRKEAFRPSVRIGWMANYLKAVTLIASNPEKWSDACAYQINRAVAKGGDPHHRWFDSGDLQSVEMLAAIVRVCEKTPRVKHWLPTREAAFVKAYRGPLPANLVIRVSSTMVDDRPRSGYAHTSTVHKKSAPAGKVCDARARANQCGDCRACWDPAVANVSYPLH